MKEMNRRNFGFRFLGITVFMVASNFFLPMLSSVMSIRLRTFSAVAMYLVLIAVIVYYFYISILRARNVGKSGWYVLWYFVPIANFAAILFLLCANERTQKVETSEIKNKSEKPQIAIALLALPCMFCILVLSVMVFDDPATTLHSVLPFFIGLYFVPFLAFSFLMYKKDHSRFILWTIVFFLFFGLGFFWTVTTSSAPSGDTAGLLKRGNLESVFSPYFFTTADTTDPFYTSAPEYEKDINGDGLADVVAIAAPNTIKPYDSGSVSSPDLASQSSQPSPVLAVFINKGHGEYKNVVLNYNAVSSEDAGVQGASLKPEISFPDNASFVLSWAEGGTLLSTYEFTFGYDFGLRTWTLEKAVQVDSDLPSSDGATEEKDLSSKDFGIITVGDFDISKIHFSESSRLSK